MTTKRLSVGLAGLLVVAVCGTSAMANVTFTLDPAANWVGYMNVFELPENGGAWQWGSAWGTADLPAVFAGDQLTIGPNTNCYNATDPYWVQPSGLGAKVMEANMYVEDTSLVGQTAVFTGSTVEYTYVDGYETRAFIKVLDPDNGWGVVAEMYEPLTQGQAFSVTLAIPDTAGLVPQYGFITTGLDADPATVDALGHAVIAPIPEPASLLLVLVGVAALRRR